uniref:Uncharacterized protein n=1 Tax=Ascaris lumbricoides TaxID=6252 RepID=A0A0M3I7T7_ASCLU
MAQHGTQETRKLFHQSIVQRGSNHEPLSISILP